MRDYDNTAGMVSVDPCFHAAALKRVPPRVLSHGSGANQHQQYRNVLNAAIASGVQRVVVSHRQGGLSDQRHGHLKAMAEKLMVAKSRMIPRQHRALRHPLRQRIASRGSVIPLFIDQIKRGEPLTITDPTMTRFLMSLEESVDLVLYAFEHARPGDIFVQKAPASTVGDLAQALKELFGCDNPVRVIGTRHGEKLYESLVSREEMAKAEDMGRYYRIPADNRDLNYKKHFVEGEENASGCGRYHAAGRLDHIRAARCLCHDPRRYPPELIKMSR